MKNISSGGRKLPGQSAYRLGKALGGVGRATERAIGSASMSRGAIPKQKTYSNEFANAEPRTFHDAENSVLGYKRISDNTEGD